MVSAERQEFLSEILAAEVLSRNFEATQSMGEIIADFLPKLFNASAFGGFSYYSREVCHEHVHGIGTCDKFLARDDACSKGM